MENDLKLENQLCHRLYVASNAIVRAYRPVLDKLDLTYPQYIVMLALWEEDNLDVGTVKNRSKIDGGALSLILKKLSAKSLITLEEDPKDRRSKKLLLTAKGRELATAARAVPESLKCMFPDVELADIEALRQSLDKLINDI